MKEPRDRIVRPPAGWQFARPTTHPGEMLLEEFLKPLHLSVAGTARKLGITPKQLADIVRERKPMTAEIALRVEQLFGMSADFWMRLQNSHDLSKARLESGAKIASSIERIATQDSVAA